MMSREEILSIEQYCSAHNVTYKQRLAELNIPFWKFYRAKQRYRNQDEAGKDGGFVLLVPGGPSQPAAMPAPRTSGRSSPATPARLKHVRVISVSKCAPHPGQLCASWEI